MKPMMRTARWLASGTVLTGVAAAALLLGCRGPAPSLPAARSAVAPATARPIVSEANMQPAEAFNHEGLVLWLDASDAATVVRDAAGRVRQWRDKSGQGHDAVAVGGASAPIWVEQAMNGKPVVRLGGAQDLGVAAIRNTTGPVSVFVVSQRLKEQASDQPWQRLVSSSDGSMENDNRSPNFCLSRAEGAAYEPVVSDLFDDGVKIAALSIGRNQRLKGNAFAGDVAEILVFNRGFVAEDPVQSVRQYLAAKWGAAIPRTADGWTRVGGLGTPPVRTTDRYPLSDQANAGGWATYAPLWDEFDGDKLDVSKWWDHNPRWQGRAPALFLPHNVDVHNGALHLTMRNESVTNAPKGYGTFTSAAVQSRTRVKYGYFEIKARPMRSHGSSAFWLYYHDEQEHTEIDIFEIGGGAPGFECKDNMNLHVFRTPTEHKHWGRGGIWTAPWKFADADHVYGLDWDAQNLLYYVDGVLVRRTANTHWHQALTLNFDSETMPSWFGLPNPGDLPSTFSIDYVRVWKKAGQLEEPLPGFD